jgi:hypothetical protein
VAVKALAIVALAAATAAAQPPSLAPDPAVVLREGNAAATAGDWSRVADLVGPLVKTQLKSEADRAEAHRLLGLAFLFKGLKDFADDQFLEYLKLEPDGRLDPTLYPPEAIEELAKVHSMHESEILRARRPKTRRLGWLRWVPVASQFQNGQRTKAWLILGAGVAFGATSFTSYLVLKDWCRNGNTSCDSPGHRSAKAAVYLRAVDNVASAAFIATIVYAVCDGVIVYKNKSTREKLSAFASPVSNGALVGFTGSW